jgi:hypothetical protein
VAKLKKIMDKLDAIMDRVEGKAARKPAAPLRKAA